MGSISSDTTRVGGKTHFCDDKDPDIPDIPPHWIFDRDELPQKYPYFYPRLYILVLHRLLCVFGFGVGNLRKIWYVSYPGCPTEMWERERDRLRLRLEHINLVVRPQGFDRYFAGFEYNVWPRPVCYSLHWWAFAPRILPCPGVGWYCHIRRRSPMSSS